MGEGCQESPQEPHYISQNRKQTAELFFPVYIAKHLKGLLSINC